MIKTNHSRYIKREEKECLKSCKIELLANTMPAAYLTQIYLCITVRADTAVCVRLSSVERDVGRTVSGVDSWCHGTLCALLHNHHF